MSTLCDENVNDIHVHCIANPSKHKHTHCITVEQVKFAHIFNTAILHYYVPVC